MAASLRRTWSRFVRVCKPFFTSEARWQAAGLLAVLVGLLVAVAALNVANSYILRDFMTALEKRASQRFFVLTLLYLAVFAGSTVAGGFARYAELLLGLRWREWLTGHVMHEYLSNHAYYRVSLKENIDNPDQRMQEDVKTFTTNSLAFFVILLNSAITVLTFSWVLWSITPWLLLAGALYPVLGTSLTLLIGRRLVGLNNLQLKKEADFRFELVRVRERADSLSVAHREGREESSLRRRLRVVLDNYADIILVIRNLRFFRGGYDYLTQLIPVLIAAPLYFWGMIEFGVVLQASMAFALLFNAFSLVVDQFQEIATFAATVDRLAALVEGVEEPPPAHAAIQVEEESGQVAYQRLTLRTPKEGRVLIRELSLEVPPGRRVLINGPNGAGKSALFRATAGAWEWGEGRIVRPPWDQIMFLPHQPYLVSGTLRDQLLDACQAGGCGEEQILVILRGLRLEPVLKRAGGLDVEVDWSRALSLGEQQLLAVARLLLVAPAYAFLDHALSALREQERCQVYELLAETETTFLSVGNTPCMKDFHEALLTIEENGQWKVESLAGQAVRR